MIINENDEQLSQLMLLVRIEILKGSKNKYEYDKNLCAIRLDRVLPMNFPVHYGSLFEDEKNEKSFTLNYDGDSLDVLVIGDELSANCIVPIRIIGALEMVDDGERDDKLVGVVSVDKRLDHIQNIDDLNSQILAEIKLFIQNYKVLDNKFVSLGKWLNKAGAQKILKNCQQLYQKFKEEIKKGISKERLVRLLNENL